MRRAAKVDGNHAAIVRRFREHGWSVRSTAMVGDDFPDIVAASPRGVTILVEAKVPKGKLTAGQNKFRATWSGPTFVAFGVEDVDAIAEAYAHIRETR